MAKYTKIDQDKKSPTAIAAVSQSRELMELLADRSKEKAKGGSSLAEVKKRLGLD